MKKSILAVTLLMLSTSAVAGVRYVEHTDPMTDEVYPQVIISSSDSKQSVTIFCKSVVVNSRSMLGWTGTKTTGLYGSGPVYEVLTYRFDKKPPTIKAEFEITQMAKQLYMRGVNYDEMVANFKASNNFSIRTYGYNFSSVGGKDVKYSLKGSTKALNKLGAACAPPLVTVTTAERIVLARKTYNMVNGKNKLDK